MELNRMTPPSPLLETGAGSISCLYSGFLPFSFRRFCLRSLPDQLQSALDAGLGKSDQVKAHKHLAFIHCSSGREPRCRDEFRKALAADPGFDLDPAEAGHPTWGPVFRSVKARR
ncbi:MAG: TssQ family T6SS-associated lipoprotein [Betaproteobacteria bacterium]|nr:TssQ family T6SS-associated lipoprotein [Betaproteobacteria bacterium]